jgi:chorismate lyase/3-hydroxybenzoate synthase
MSVSDHHLFLMSGTAAVIGHESAHPGDAVEQTKETMRNIESLLAGDSWSDEVRQSKAIRVYLRKEEDYPHVAPIVTEFFAASGLQVAFLRGDICRKELLVEIDGAFCRE